MRAKHFVAEQLLSELAMTPNALHKMAAGIEATAGMEFEMYVPNAAGIGRDESDYDQEEDYSHDPRPDSIEEIVEFFDQNDYNDRRSLERLNNDLQNNFQEWCSEQFEGEWQSEGKDAIRDWIVNNEWVQEDEILIALEEMDISDEEKADAQKAGVENLKSRGSADKVAFGHWHDAVNRADEKLEERTEEEWDYGDRTGKGRIYNDARDEMQSYTNYDEREWCRDQGFREMSDVMREYSINWPIYSSPDYGQGDMSIDDIAGEFAQMIGRDVNASNNYHGAKREPGKYCLEPDGSLDEPESSEDGGLEFISPPLPLAEMLADLKKVKEWAGRNGCYTNESTGLHINVSVPNVSEDTLDYVKLALLLGDKHVLDEFGRAGNTFCKSAFEEVKTRVRMNPSKATELLAKMKSGLDKFASRAIHNGSTGKYISINNKGGYIEFRSPGGDWLDENFDKIENTLLRTVVALDAAVDPQKSRQEYLKKLYTLLAPSSNDDPINVFARYSAGEFTEMPKETLKFLLNRINVERELATKSPDAPLPDRKKMRPAPVGSKQGVKYWFNVRKGGATIEVVAATPSEAKNEARKQWGIRDIDAPDDALTARPLRRYVEDNYEFFRKSDGQSMLTFHSDSLENATGDQVMSPYTDTNLYGVRAIVTPAQQVSDIANSDEFAQVTGGNRPAPNWEVYDSNTGEMKFQFYAVDGVAAVEQQHMSAYANDPFRVRPIATESGQWGRWFASARGLESPIAVSARNEREALMKARSENPDETILHVWREGTTPPTTTANSSAPEQVIHLYKVTAPNGHSVNISAVSTLLARRIYVANYGTHRTDQNALTVELLPDPDAAPAAPPTPQPTWRVIFGNLNHVDVQAADYTEAKDIVTRRYEAQRAGAIADNGGIIRVQLASGLS